MRRTSWWILPVVLFGFTSCGAEAAPEGAPQEGSPATQERDRGPWQRGGLVLTETPLLSIGAVSGSPEYQFQDVRGAVRLADGRIVVADRGAQNLRWFDASGRHLRTAGRRGEGPGEFLGLIAVFTYGDSVIAFDERLQRVSVFSPEGEVARSFQSPTSPGLLQGVFGDGTFLMGFVMGERAPVTEGYRRILRRTFHLGREGEVLDTLPEFPDREESITVTEVGGRRGVGSMPTPFGRQTVFAVHGTRFAVGTQDRRRVQLRAPDGSERMEVVWDGPSLAVSDEVLEKHRDYRLGRAQGPEGRRRIQRQLESEVYPDFLPAYKEIRFDPAGNLWVEDYWFWGSGPVQWQVFDPGGTRLGSVGFPERFLVFEIGVDYVLGKWWDELDVDHIRLYGLEDSAG